MLLLLLQPSMAIRLCSSSSSTLIIIPRKTNKTLPRVLMLHKDDKQQSKHTSLLLAKSAIAIKVFEDQEAGIVCYRDEKGEVICEGHDEGPRFCQRKEQTCSIANGRLIREVQSFDFLHQWWLQIIEDSNFDNLVSGVAVQDKK